MITVATIFFVQTINPINIALIDFGFRGNVAAYFLAGFTGNPIAIIATTVTLWFINLIVPAIIGGILSVKIYFLRKNKLYFCIFRLKINSMSNTYSITNADLSNPILTKKYIADGVEGHPKQLAPLFFTEMWERFSFYGMRALLVLFMVHQLKYADAKANLIYGTYTALVYLMPLFGGIAADKILGYRRAIILGGALMAIGHLILAVPCRVVVFCRYGILNFW